MKVFLKLIFVFIFLFLISCVNKPVSCTEDALICPDGSSVERVLPDCDFAKCSINADEGEMCDYEENKIRKYVKKDEDSCKRVMFACEPERKPFYDECGCGCELKDNQQESEQKNFCTEEQKDIEVCSEEFQPVCGWFNDSLKCIRFPCARGAA